MGILTLDEVLERSKIVDEEFTVPEWNGNVLLKGLSKRDQKYIWKEAEKTDGSGDVDPDILVKLLILHGVVEPKISSEDFERLLDGYAGTLDKVAMAVMKVSHFGDEEVKKAAKSVSDR